MKKFAVVLIAILMAFKGTSQPITPELIVSIHLGKQDNNDITKLLVAKGLTYGIYKDTLLQLANQRSLIDDNFVLFEMFLDNRFIEYRVCKESTFDSWSKDLELLGFVWLGSGEVNGCMTDLYAKDDLRIGISINPKEPLLKYKFFLYNVTD